MWYNGGGALEHLSHNIRQQAEKRARAALDCGKNRLKLVVGILFSVAITVVMWSISDIAEMLLWHLIDDAALCTLIADAFHCLLIIFTVAPVYLGLFFVAARMLCGEETEIADIFDCFSSPRLYGRAIGVALRLFVRLLPVVIVLRAPYAFGALSMSLEIPEYLYGGAALLVAVALSAVLVLPVASSFGLVSFSLFYPEQGIRVAVKMARKARKGSYRYVLSLAYSTLLRLLLSLFTIGVVTLIQTIPLSLLRYAAMARELDNNEPKGII